MVEWLDSNRDWVIFKNPKVAFTRRRVTWSLKNIFECLSHRDRGIHIERECLAVFTFAKPGCFVRQICFLLFLYYSNGS